MSSLTFLEKRKLEKLFGMASGYVLDFSDRTFQEFVGDSVGLDIFESRGGVSKTNCLRRFWKTQRNADVGKLLSDLIDYFREIEHDPDLEVIADECETTAQRLRNSQQSNGTMRLAESLRNAVQTDANGPSKVDPVQVFISYASPNLGEVRRLVAFLEDNGITTWFDKKDLLGGQDWEYVIRSKIIEAHIALVCLSTSAVDRRGFFHQEMRYAVGEAMKLPKGKAYIIPIRFDDCAIPDGLKKWHALDVFIDADYSPVLASIRDAIGGD